MEVIQGLTERVSELLAVAAKVKDRHNTSVFISLEDFNDQKYYLYCSKEVWQKSLQLQLEGKRFMELSNEEFQHVEQKQIEL